VFTPFLLVLEITDRCNLNCTYCYTPGREPVGDMDGPQIRDILLQAKALGTRHVILSGGEPLLHHDILDVIEMVHGMGMQVHITSNGTGLDAALASALQRVNAQVTVSVDGSTGAINDRLRGKGTFDAALRAVDLLKRHAIFTSMRMTVVKDNLSDVGDYLRLARSKGVDRCIFERMTPVGRGRNRRDEVIDAGHLNSLFTVMKQNLGDGIQVGTNDPLWIFFREALLEKKRDCSSIAAGCTAGVAAYCIRPDLSVTGCPRLPVPCGSLQRESLAEIWEHSEVFHNLRHRELFQKCSDCAFTFLCGGCRGAALAEGDYLGPDPQCWMHP